MPAISVVVADLDPETRDLTVQLLRAAGYPVYPAADADTFHTLLRVSPTSLVAVVRLDAPELAQALVALFPSSPPAPPAPPAPSAPPAPPAPGLPAAPPPSLPASEGEGEEQSESSPTNPTLVPWAQRHAVILMAKTPRTRLVATALVRLRSVFVRYAPVPQTAYDAVRLLTLVAEASQVLDTSCP